MEKAGPFDWAKYAPIEVLEENGVRYLQSGMTRTAIARRAGITQLPAYVIKP